MDGEKKQPQQSKIIAENLTLVGIQRWLDERHKVKKSDKPFNIQDVEGYITREQIPNYLGGHKIVLVENKYNKLYNLIEKEKNNDG